MNQLEFLEYSLSELKKYNNSLNPNNIKNLEEIRKFDNVFYIPSEKYIARRKNSCRILTCLLNKKKKVNIAIESLIHCPGSNIEIIPAFGAITFDSNPSRDYPFASVKFNLETEKVSDIYISTFGRSFFKSLNSFYCDLKFLNSFSHYLKNNIPSLVLKNADISLEQGISSFFEGVNNFFLTLKSY
jgi:hypothetical protein